jgi:hypothetical protein
MNSALVGCWFVMVIANIVKVLNFVNLTFIGFMCSLIYHLLLHGNQPFEACQFSVSLNPFVVIDVLNLGFFFGLLTSLSLSILLASIFF